MKILLINPIIYNSIDDFIRDSKRMKINSDEPVGIMYISSYLKSHGYECEVYDWHIECLKFIYNYKYEIGGVGSLKKLGIDILNEKPIYDILEFKIKDYAPDIVGISALYEFNSEISLEVAKIVKMIDKKIITVMGGIFASTLEIQSKYIDYVIKGEGEIKFLKLIQNIESNKVNNTKNIILFETKKDYLHDLNDCKYPDRKNIPVGMYSIYGRQTSDRFYHEGSRTATIQTDRGCPFQCRYCSGHVITQRHFRKRSIAGILMEISYLKSTFNIEVFIFNSENAIVDIEWTKELYRELIPLKIKWYHNGGFYPSLMDRELTQLAIDSGLIMFNLAIESGSKIMLKLLNKTEKIVDMAPKVMKWIRDYSDIYVTAFFLSGFPFENEKDIELSKKLANDMDVDWIFWNLFQPFKGCELYQCCIDNNYLELNENMDQAHYIGSKLKNCILDMDKLSKDIYNFQLWYNFDNNRCIRTGNIDQAKRDFQHVLNVTEGKHEKAKYYLDIINKIDKE